MSPAAAGLPDQLTMGVIGHVRHGKTTLVRALTGVATDRLPEEKARGMSIVLGFAHLSVAGRTVDLIDAPGHEAFVRTMIAGATGMDAVMLVVDAHEGVMPQTREHLRIAALLGLRDGVIALNKADLVPQDRRLDVEQAVCLALEECGLPRLAHAWVSADRGEGLDALRAAIARLPPPRRRAASGGFHLPLDRVFDMPGRGVVATGTLRYGELRPGVVVQAFPDEGRGTVRELQVHGNKVDVALPGQRVGVNLRGLKSTCLRAGQVLAPPSSLMVGDRIDAWVRLLPAAERSLKNNDSARLAFSTCETAVRISILGAPELAPGASGFVQLRVAHPIAGASGETFILRAGSPLRTLGGGRFLDVAVPRHRRTTHPDVVERLQLLQQDVDGQLRALLSSAGQSGTTAADMARRLKLDATAALALAERAPFAMIHGNSVFDRDTVADAAGRLREAVLQFHREQPESSGPTIAWCRSRLGTQSVPVPTELFFGLVLRLLREGGDVVVQDNRVRCRLHDPLQALPPALRDAMRTLEQAFRNGRAQPPDPESVLAHREMRCKALQVLMQRGDLVPVADRGTGRPLLFHREALDHVRKSLLEGYPPPQAFTVSQARELLGSTRKFMVPLLEHFDDCRITRRSGDRRVMLTRQVDREGGADMRR